MNPYQPLAGLRGFSTNRMQAATGNFAKPAAGMYELDQWYRPLLNQPVIQHRA